MSNSSLIARMTGEEQLAYVRAQVYECEEATARALLEYHGLPFDNVSVRRLVFARELFMTLRLREYTV